MSTIKDILAQILENQVNDRKRIIKLEKEAGINQTANKILVEYKNNQKTVIEPTIANIPKDTKHIVCFVINDKVAYAESKRLGTYKILKVNVTKEEADRVKTTKGTVQVNNAFTATKELYHAIKNEYVQIFVNTDKN